MSAETQKWFDQNQTKRSAKPISALVAASNCRVKFSVSGAQTLAPSCPSYSASGKMFQFNWKLGTKGTGDAALTVTISYPGTTLVTTRSETVTITP